jgi:hypothetical protein
MSNYMEIRPLISLNALSENDNSIGPKKARYETSHLILLFLVVLAMTFYYRTRTKVIRESSAFLNVICASFGPSVTL